VEVIPPCGAFASIFSNCRSSRPVGYAPDAYTGSIRRFWIKATRKRLPGPVYASSEGDKLSVREKGACRQVMRGSSSLGRVWGVPRPPDDLASK